jgi:glycosyltransferase involved in cell wall biosynthesis
VEKLMRLAFVDLVFSWPPNGGADVDLFHTAKALQALGHEVHLFVSGLDASSERGAFDPEALPFPATRLVMDERDLKPKKVAAAFRKSVDAWNPDGVFVCNGFFFKPALIDALAHHPIAARYYAYEVACMRDLLLYKDGAPCPNNYLETPNECRKCALQGMRKNIRKGELLTWPQEFMASRAYMPGYHRRLSASLRKLNSAIVYNEIQERHIENFVDDVHVVPGGVDAQSFEASAPPTRGAGEKKVILMAGRVEDSMKGLATMREAGALLSEHRADFEIWATHTDHTLNCDWFRSIGWHDHEGVRALYAESDICVVPSLWEEPFGMVAVEAMASGRPVCASRVGGLQGIVTHGETGFLFDRADGKELAAQLDKLLDNADLRTEMGEKGRRRVEEEYDWGRVIANHYPAIFEGMGL